MELKSISKYIELLLKDADVPCEFSDGIDNLTDLEKMSFRVNNSDETFPYFIQGIACLIMLDMHRIMTPVLFGRRNINEITPELLECNLKAAMNIETLRMQVNGLKSKVDLLTFYSACVSFIEKFNNTTNPREIMVIMNELMERVGR